MQLSRRNMQVIIDTAAKMTQKTFTVAGILVLAIQLQRIQSMSASPTDDLESAKEDAVELISKTHERLSEVYREMISVSVNANSSIAGNEIMMNELKETADRSLERMSQLAEQLSEKGKNDGKPEGYFLCLEEHGKTASKRIKEERDNYKKNMVPFQEKALLDVEYSVNFMEAIFSAIEVVRDEFLEKIDSCTDKTCIRHALKELEHIYSHGELILNKAWNISASAFLKFKSIARAKLTETEQSISKISKSGQEDMLRC